MNIEKYEAQANKLGEMCKNAYMQADELITKLVHKQAGIMDFYSEGDDLCACVDVDGIDSVIKHVELHTEAGNMYYQCFTADNKITVDYDNIDLLNCTIKHLKNAAVK